MQSNTFLKPSIHTHTQVKVTSECLEPVITLCQSKGMNAPSAPFYRRGWSDVNIFLITVATPVPNSTPFPNSSPIPWPQTYKSYIRAFGLSLRFLYPKLQNHSQLDHFHSQIHAANWLCPNHVRPCQCFIRQYKSLVPHPRDSECLGDSGKQLDLRTPGLHRRY